VTQQFHEGQTVRWVAAPNHPDDPPTGTTCQIIYMGVLGDIFDEPLMEVEFPGGRRALACDSDIETVR